MTISPISPENEVEAIVIAWMQHEGYTDEEIEHAATLSCRDAGCEPYDAGEVFGAEFTGQTVYDCTNEDGNSMHPARDRIHEVADMAEVAIEALASFRAPAEGVQQ